MNTETHFNIEANVPVLKPQDDITCTCITEADEGSESIVAQFFDNCLNGRNRINRHVALFVQSQQMENLLNAAIRLWPEFDKDKPVSGANLVDWFGAFLEDAKVILANIPSADKAECQSDQGGTADVTSSSSVAPPATSSDIECDHFPGAVRSEVGHVNMTDLIGDYDNPADVEEWKWVETVASFAHADNGQDGIWEFVVNLTMIEAGDDGGIPERLLPVFKEASFKNYAYLIFHNGT